MPVELSAPRGTEAKAQTPRSEAPVFVLGCGRSGTKLLYHTLLSAGGFAVYHAESNAFNLIGLRFGSLERRRNREKLLQAWLRSKLFVRSGLTEQEIAPRILDECRNAGDFLRLLMETIAHKQGVRRWAESTPLHLLCLRFIKRVVPDALIIHIIRDGRDVALSLNKIGWIRPLPWDRRRSLIAAGIFWKWMVTKGLSSGRDLGRDYIEVHYEELLHQPRETLARLSAFIDQTLDYDHIQKIGLGTVNDPNSSFRDDEAQGRNPLGRWKALLSAEQLAELEGVIGDLLVELGYRLAAPRNKRRGSLPVRIMSRVYPAWFDLKLWLKTHTPLARLAAVGRMGIGQQ
ncbi:MAG TPA: sulfotransferase [Terriglobales bacterium]|nr:sulfotransferase [Terriglobales bacterium]